MHNNSLVYKGIIKEFDENLDSVSVTRAMYKIINIINIILLKKYQLDVFFQYIMV